MSDWDIVNRETERQIAMAEQKTKRMTAIAVSAAAVFIVAIFFGYLSYRNYVHRNDPRMADGPFMCYELNEEPE